MSRSKVADIVVFTLSMLALIFLFFIQGKTLEKPAEPTLLVSDHDIILQVGEKGKVHFLLSQELYPDFFLLRIIGGQDLVDMKPEDPYIGSYNYSYSVPIPERFYMSFTGKKVGSETIYIQLEQIDNSENGKGKIICNQAINITVTDKHNHSEQQN